MLRQVLKNNGYDTLREICDKDEGLHPNDITDEEYLALGLTQLRSRRKFKRALIALVNVYDAFSSLDNRLGIARKRAPSQGQ